MLLIMFVIDDLEILNYSPLGYLCNGAVYLINMPARRKEQINKDYLEVLNLIEWKSRELSPIEHLQEELEISIYESKTQDN